MFEESPELEAVREVYAKAERIERKIDWIAGIVICAVSLSFLYFIRQIGTKWLGDTGQTIIDVICGFGLLLFPAFLWVYYDTQANNERRRK